MASPFKKLQRSALTIASGTAVSRVLGLLRDIMIARLLAPEVRDAFIVAFRLPNFFRRIFSEGSLAVSFVPAYVATIPDPQRSRRLLDAAFTAVCGLAIAVSALGILWMRPLLSVLVSGDAYMSVPGKFDLTVRLAQIMFGFVGLVSLYAYFAAVLASYKRFALAAFAPALLNITLVGMAFFRQGEHESEVALSWAVLAGGFLQMIVLVPALVRLGVLPRLRFTGVWSPDLSLVLRKLIPGIIGVSLLQITTLVNVYFASWLPQGTHTYFYLADRLLELPLALFVLSLGSTLLPTLSELWLARDADAMNALVNRGVRLMTVLALPAALGLFILAPFIAHALFAGGEFSADDVLRTSLVIRMQSTLLLTASLVRVMAQGFYARGDVRHPAIASGLSLVAHVILAALLTRAWGLSGLALCGVLSSSINIIYLSVSHLRGHGSFEVRALLDSVARALPGLLFVGAWAFAYTRIEFGISSHTLEAVVLMLWCAVGAAVYLSSLRVLRVAEVIN